MANININANTLWSAIAPAPTSVDNVYIAEAATLTNDVNPSVCNKIYLGDNSGATAAVKRGFYIQNAGVALTIYDTVANGGLDGKGTTSAWTFNGSAASPCTVTGNTASKVSNTNNPANLITATFTTFTTIKNIYMGAAHSFVNCNFTTCDYGLYFDNTQKTLPASLNGTTFTGISSGGAAIYDVTTTTPLNWGGFFVRNKIKLVGNASGPSQVMLRFGTTNGIARYLLVNMSANPIAWFMNLRGRGGMGAIR